MRAFVLLAAVICAARSATVPLHQLAAAGLVHPSSAGYFLGDAPAPGAVASPHHAAYGASFAPSPAFAPAKFAAESMPGAFSTAGYASPMIFPASPAGIAGASYLARAAGPAASIYNSPAPFANPAASPPFFADSPAVEAGAVPAASAFSPYISSAAPAGVASPFIAKCWPIPCASSPAAPFANPAASPSFFADSPAEEAVTSANVINAPSAPAASPYIYSAVPAGVASPVPYVRAALPDGSPSVTVYAPGSTVAFAPMSAPGAPARFVELAASGCAECGPAGATGAVARYADPSVAAGAPVFTAAPGSYFSLRSPGAAIADAIFGPTSAVPASPAGMFFAPASASAGLRVAPSSFMGAPNAYIATAAGFVPAVAPESARYVPGSPVTFLPHSAAAPTPASALADLSAAHYTSAAPTPPARAYSPSAAF